MASLANQQPTQTITAEVIDYIYGNEPVRQPNTKPKLPSLGRSRLAGNLALGCLADLSAGDIEVDLPAYTAELTELSDGVTLS